MKLFYTDVPLHWWQMYKLGLNDSELLVYAYIFDMTYNHPEEDGVSFWDLVGKFSLTAPEAEAIIQNLLDDKLIHFYDEAYYALPLPEKIRKAIRRFNKTQKDL